MNALLYLFVEEKGPVLNFVYFCCFQRLIFVNFCFHVFSSVYQKFLAQNVILAKTEYLCNRSYIITLLKLN